MNFSRLCQKKTGVLFRFIQKNIFFKPLRYHLPYVVYSSNVLTITHQSPNKVPTVMGIINDSHSTAIYQSKFNKIAADTCSQVWFAFRCIGRTVYLLINFVPLIVTFPLYLFHKSFTSTWHHLLLQTLERCGPTFVKLGQWISTRPDIFPQDLTMVLSKLHDDVRPDPFQRTRETLEREFGMGVNDVFEWIKEEPVGSGCIAQVYIAKLKMSTKDRNELVAVKVQRNGIKQMIALDLSVLKFFSILINALPTMKWLSLPEEVEQFKQLMYLQLDLTLEAKNLIKFRENFSDDSKFSFPSPIIPYVTEKVLVEEFVDAAPMKMFLCSSQTEIRKTIAELGLNAFLKMMLLDNFIHSDLHPGNIMVQLSTGNETAHISNLLNSEGELDDVRLRRFIDQGYHPKLVFVDAGLVTTLTETNMNNFVDLFTAIADGNGKLVAQLMVERSRAPEPKCKDYQGFEQKMICIISQVQKKTFQLANIVIGDLLKQVFSLVREHHVKIESDFANLIVSIMVLEGLGRQLDPKLDLFEAARPFLRFRKSEFYTQRGGIFLKLSAFLEARFWLIKEHSEDYEIVDTLIFRNF